MSKRIYLSGIYNIINTVSEDHYIGSSHDVGKRWQQHARRLFNGNHENDHFQKAWNKYGPDAFAFSLVEYVSPDDLLKVEQLYLDAYFNTGCLYNIYPIAGSRRGAKATEASRLRMRLAHLGVPLSDEHKESLRVSSMGMKHTAETKRLMSEAKKGKPFSAAHIRALSAAKKGKPGRLWTEEQRQRASVTQIGKVLSEETKRKISLTKRGIQHPS